MPQPVDMQTELGRAIMADRIQQANDRAALVSAMRARVEEDDERGVAETQVAETAETQSEHVDGEGKRKNPFVGRRRKGSASGKDSPGAKGLRGHGPSDEHHFDVSV